MVFRLRTGFSSSPLRFVSYAPSKPGESFKEASKYKHFQRIVVFCSKTDTVAQFTKSVFLCRDQLRENKAPGHPGELGNSIQNYGNPYTWKKHRMATQHRDDVGKGRRGNARQHEGKVHGNTARGGTSLVPRVSLSQYRHALQPPLIRLLPWRCRAAAPPSWVPRTVSRGRRRHPAPCGLWRYAPLLGVPPFLGPHLWGQCGYHWDHPPRAAPR